MNGLSLLGEFFVTGFRLLWLFLSHPITIGAVIMFFVLWALSELPVWLAMRFKNFPYRNLFYSVSEFISVSGTILFCGYLFYALFFSSVAPLPWMEGGAT